MSSSTNNELLELDDLLSESVEIAQARRAAKTGKRLTQEQAELLEANQLAIDREVWTDVLAVAHFVEVECACGEAHRKFGGWYVLQQHKRWGASRKLVRAGDHRGLPMHQYSTQELVSFCAQCLHATMPVISQAELPMLSAFGEAFEGDAGQLEMELLEVEVGANDMLRELGMSIEEGEEA